jgi:hypothetical protein
VSQFAYDVAQICPNGHVATSSYNQRPESRRECCESCGEPTIKDCPKCRQPVRGTRYRPGYPPESRYHRPAFCRSCGSSFSWTERKQRAAIDLFIDECQDEADRREFEESVGEIAKDTPQALLAARRLTRLLGKAAKETAKAIRNILVDVASEAAKKALLP